MVWVYSSSCSSPLKLWRGQKRETHYLRSLKGDERQGSLAVVCMSAVGDEIDLSQPPLTAVFDGDLN